MTLIAERYERRSLGVTSNLVFSEWEKVFANPMATAAAIDRIVHHSVILEFDVPSYRTSAAQNRQTDSDRYGVRPAKMIVARPAKMVDVEQYRPLLAGEGGRSTPRGTRRRRVSGDTQRLRGDGFQEWGEDHRQAGHHRAQSRRQRHVYDARIGDPGAADDVRLKLFM